MPATIPLATDAGARHYGSTAVDHGQNQVLPGPSSADSSAKRSVSKLQAVMEALFFTHGTNIYRISQGRTRTMDDNLPLPSENLTSECVSRLIAAYEAHGHSIWKATLFTYWPILLGISFGQAVLVGCAIFAPIVLQHVVLAFSGDSVDVEQLTFWVLVFFVSRVANVVAATQVDYFTSQVHLRLCAAIRSFIFRKAMLKRVDHQLDQSSGQGGKSSSEDANKPDVIKLATKDTTSIIQWAYKLTGVWTIVPQIGVVAVLLIGVLGPLPVFAGISVLIATLALNVWVARKMDIAYRDLAKVGDQRMGVVKELFGSIQIVKFNAWERKFAKKLGSARARELRALRKYCYIDAVSQFVLWSSPVCVTGVSFAVYTLVLGHQLTAARVFTAIALFNVIRDPLRNLPSNVRVYVQAKVSTRRLQRFLDSPEISSAGTHHNQSEFAVVIRDGFFSWSPPVLMNGEETISPETQLLPPYMSGDAGTNTSILSDINLEIKKGEFVVVHGSVGSGKSSLCAAILHEMTCVPTNGTPGHVEVNGSVAYYAQQPWIQNLTVRDNILFGRPLDVAFYERVLDACCLRDDLAQFPAGDLTEIGEKGINLSGGQKARVSLARACYSRADIFILDSPLAAVDTVVQRHLIDHCFCDLLSDKTVVLVTHNPDIIQSDFIDCRVRLENGTVAAFERVAIHRPRCSRASVTVAHPQRSSQQLMTVLNDDKRGKLIEDEVQQEGKVSGSVWKKYLSAIGGFPMLWTLLATQTLWQVFQISGDYWLGASAARDQSNASEAPTGGSDYGHYLLIYAILAFTGALMVFIRGVIITLISLRGAQLLFDTMTVALLHAPLRFFDTTPIGRIIARYSSDMDAVDLVLPAVTSPGLSSFFSLAFALFTTAATLRSLSLVFVPVAIYYIRIVQGYVHTFRDIQRLFFIAVAPILGHFSQCDQGVMTIRAFGDATVARIIKECDTRIDVNSISWHTETVMRAWFILRIQMLVSAVLAVLLGGFVVFHEWFSPALVGLTFTYALSLDASVFMFMKQWSKSENSMVSVERILEYGKIEPEGSWSSDLVVAIEPDESWPERGEIQFDNVCFRYKPDDPLVLRNVSFSVNKHEKIGIVGRTGAGKSSLTMALFRMNELASGHIYIDGVDVSVVPLECLRSRVSIIPQSPVLMRGSLRRFLDPFDEFADEVILQTLEHVEMIDKLTALAHAANADTALAVGHESSVLSLPVSANGENFSVGERQMLCLARALLVKSSIVVLDEATAFMDHATEQKLTDMLRRELQNVTLLVIAHRLTTVMDSDRILVIDDGHLVEFDSPTHLLAKENGMFAKFVREASRSKHS